MMCFLPFRLFRPFQHARSPRRRRFFQRDNRKIDVIKSKIDAINARQTRQSGQCNWRTNQYRNHRLSHSLSFVTSTTLSTKPPSFTPSFSSSTTFLMSRSRCCLLARQRKTLLKTVFTQWHRCHHCQRPPFTRLNVIDHQHQTANFQQLLLNQPLSALLKR